MFSAWSMISSDSGEALNKSKDNAFSLAASEEEEDGPQLSPKIQVQKRRNGSAFDR